MVRSDSVVCIAMIYNMFFLLEPTRLSQLLYVQGIPLRNGLHTYATVELGKRALIDTLHSKWSTMLMTARKRKGAESENDREAESENENDREMIEKPNKMVKE